MKNGHPSFYTLFGIPAILVLIFLVGWLWNLSDTCMEKTSNPPIGQMVDIFDTKVHVYSVGERRGNKPAVVFFSGLATPSPTADFYPLWSRLYGEYQAVVLERPGYGWSESTKRERSVQNITEEYRSALRQAGIDPPYILVAHSIGGLEAAMFAVNYINDVQGVVLLDCTSPESMLPHKNSVPLLNRLFPAMRTVGLLRLISAINPNILSNQSAGMRNNFIMLDEYHRTLDKIFVLQKYQDTMMIKEQEMRLINAKTAAENPFPPNLPVSMIVAVQPGDENYPEYHEFMEKQAAWVNQSEKGRLYTLQGRHYIHHYAPDEIRDIIVSMATVMD